MHIHIYFQGSLTAVIGTVGSGKVQSIYSVLKHANYSLFIEKSELAL